MYKLICRRERIMSRSQAESKAREEILLLILKRRLVPGQRITEKSLAELCEVSRTPVRTALRELIAEGILERDEPKGYVIPPLTPPDMLQIFQIRQELEGMAAALAAESPEPCYSASLRQIEALQEEEKRIYRNWNTENFTRNSQEFHHCICRMSGNPYLEKYILQSYWRSQIYVFFFDAFFLHGFDSATDPEPVYGYSFAEHNDILEALRNRDGQRARNAMEKHILSTYKWLTNSRR
jgi:DNA-binding GntR family transcriptional regulator